MLWYLRTHKLYRKQLDSFNKGFLNTVNASINIRGIWIPRKRRVQDLILMDEIEKHDMTKQETRIINNWRILYQVLTVSDLTNQQGTHIRKRIFRQIIKSTKTWTQRFEVAKPRKTRQ
jgi:hypothetical protein